MDKFSAHESELVTNELNKINSNYEIIPGGCTGNFDNILC